MVKLIKGASGTTAS